MSGFYNAAVQEEAAYGIGALQEKVEALRNKGVEIINCTIGDPKDPPHPSVSDTLMQSLSSQECSQYPPYIGTKSLREALAQWATQHAGNSLCPNTQVLACNGTKEAVFSFPLLMDWSHGHHILIPSLSYPVYQMSAAYHGIPYTYLPLTESNGFLPNLQAIPAETLKKTRLFWINSPHNPTTAVASKQYLQDLVILAETYDFIVCSDECYNDLYTHTPPASIMEIDSSHWVCFRSISKCSHMTGYRSGGIFSQNTELMALLKKMRSPMGVGTPSFIQDAATWAWSNETHVEAHREHYNHKRNRLRAAVTQAGIQVFGGDTGFYMWCKSPKYHTSQALAEWFLSKGIMVTPGTVFGPDGDPYIRMVYCVTDDVLEAICKALGKPD